MKYLTYSLLILFVAAGCGVIGSDDDETVELGTMVARIDGERVDLNFAFAKNCIAGAPADLCGTLVDQDVLPGDVIEINALELDTDGQGEGALGRGISVVIVDFSGEGEYSLDPGDEADIAGAQGDEGMAAVQTSNGGYFNTWWLGGSGSVEVTHSSADRVAGTFEFTGRDNHNGRSVRVTDGRFNVEICDESYECLAGFAKSSAELSRRTSARLGSATKH